MVADAVGDRHRNPSPTFRLKPTRPPPAYSSRQLALLLPRSLRAFSETARASQGKLRQGEELMLPSPSLPLPKDKSQRISAAAPCCSTDSGDLGYTPRCWLFFLPCLSLPTLTPVFWDQIPNNYLHSVFDGDSAFRRAQTKTDDSASW